MSHFAGFHLGDNLLRFVSQGVNFVVH
jgi:hypothetical protein